MVSKIGPEGLAQFEDRVLYYLVQLTGDRPMALGQGVSEADLASHFTDELGIASEFIGSEQFHASEARGIMLAAVTALENEGLLEADKVFGPWTIRPTRDGRRRVVQWREEWDRQRQVRDREVQRHILKELDRQRRADPSRYQITSRIDVDGFCSQLDIDKDTYLANAQQLLRRGLIAEYTIDQFTIANGNAYITTVGVESLTTVGGQSHPQRDANEAWVEVARMKRRLQLAERDQRSLIDDEELRRRCEDLLAAGDHFDRVIREACVILENRVRTAIGADSTQVGSALMEQAFSPKNDRAIRLSDVEQEQVGAMQFYRGTMAFFRNAAGHRLIASYTQEDALRFVAWVDLLLRMLKGTT